MAAIVAAAASSWNGGIAAQTAAPFTQDQVDAGRDDYLTNCSSCHGKELSGATAPALTGKFFSASWSKHTIADLFTFIQSMMPHGQGGTLSDDSYANIVAFILSKNGAKAGNEPLTATTNAKIGKIVSGGPAKYKRRANSPG
jgi:mono/diheme cytochrome c family protein